MLPPVGIEPGPLIEIACKTETLGSLYIHALLIPTKSSKSKNQVVHEQKFKDLLSNTCQISSERRVLDLESEVMRDLGSILTGGNIFHWIFFHIYIFIWVCSCGKRRTLPDFRFEPYRSFSNFGHFLRDSDFGLTR